VRWRTVLLLLIPAMLAVLAAAAGVACLVPVRFTVSAPGRVEPARRIRVTAARNGLLLYVREPGPVRAGEVLFRQSTDTEDRRIRFLERRLRLLQDLLDEEEKRLERLQKQREINLAAAKREQALAERMLAQTRDEVHPLEEKLDALARQEKQEREALARKELEVLEKLAKEQSVPAQEVVRGRTAAAVAALQKESAEVRAEVARLERQRAVAELEAALQREKDRLERLALDEPDRRAWFQVRQQIETLSEQLADVRDDLDAKEIRAPWDGQWLAREMQPGEYAAQGRAIGILADASSLRFSGLVREAQARWLRSGLSAKLRLRAYPYIRYGRIPARLFHFEPVGMRASETGGGYPSPGAEGAYRVELKIVPGAKSRFRVLPGMVGQADIIVFRGTLLQYLLAEPGIPERGGKPGILDLLKR